MTVDFKKHKRKRKENIFLRICLLFILAILSIAFLMESSRNVSLSYRINDLNKKSKRLVQEREVLELKKSKLQSLSSIEDRLKKFKMVSVDKIDYIELGGAMAVK